MSTMNARAMDVRRNAMLGVLARAAVHRRHDELVAAQGHYRQLRAMTRELRVPELEAAALAVLAQIELVLGRPGCAERRMAQAAVTLDGTPDGLVLLGALAKAEAKLGSPATAILAYKALLERVGPEHVELRATVKAQIAELSLGKPATVAEMLTASMRDLEGRLRANAMLWRLGDLDDLGEATPVPRLAQIGKVVTLPLGSAGDGGQGWTREGVELPQAA